MLERMAIASLKARGMHPLTDIVDVWKLYNKKTITEEMKAVLEAMKEPTEEMIKNGAIFDSSEPSLRGYNRAKDNAKTSWQSMIEAALKE